MAPLQRTDRLGADNAAIPPDRRNYVPGEVSEQTFARLRALRELLGQLTNREQALAVWALVFLGWMMMKPDTRRSLGGLVRAFTAPKLLLIVVAGAIYTAGCVVGLRAARVWEPVHLKESIVWFAGTALVMVFTHQQLGSPG